MSHVPVKSCMPQGSVVGPALLLLYINDLPKQTDSNFRLFGDDGIFERLISTEEDQAILLKDLNKFIMWEDRCNLTFHPVPNLPRELIKEKAFLRQYCPCGETLQEVDYTKFLGVTLASDATFRTQINAVINHASLELLRWALKFGAASVKEQAYS